MLTEEGVSSDRARTVLKVVLRYDPFPPRLPGLMQEPSGEAFFCVTQEFQIGDHRGYSYCVLCELHHTALKIGVVAQSWS